MSEDFKNDFDILIKNTKIIDGSGGKAFNGDIGIKGKRISEVGRIKSTGRIEIDGTGYITCPGFIDPHTHIDVSIFKNPQCINYIAQGVTTAVVGNCGVSASPMSNKKYKNEISSTWGVVQPEKKESFSIYLDSIDKIEKGINIVQLIGHNSIRASLMKQKMLKPATREEISKMIKVVANGMEAGAFGISFGLDAGMPGFYASREELVEILKAVSEYDGIFTPHTRHHQNQWPIDNGRKSGYGLYHGQKGEIIAGRYHGLVEALELSKAANNIKLHIAHLTPAYNIPYPHSDILDINLAEETLKNIVDRGIDEGIDLSFNVIPSESSISSKRKIINSLFNKKLQLPKWYSSITKEQFVINLTNNEFRQKAMDFLFSGLFKFDMVNPVTDPYWMDCFTIINCNIKEYENRTIGNIARNLTPNNTYKSVYHSSLTVLFDTLIADPNTTWIQTIDKRESKVYPTFLRHPKGIPMTDGISIGDLDIENDSLYGISPNMFGMFPKYFKENVKERNILSIEQAIKKVTSVPAKEIFNIEDRGLIKKGYFADLVLLDIDTLEDRGTFDNPTVKPEGINTVIINGTMVYKEKNILDTSRGMLLRKNNF